MPIFTQSFFANRKRNGTLWPVQELSGYKFRGIKKSNCGKAANKSRGVLEKICREEINAELNELPGICNGDSYLCYYV